MILCIWWNYIFYPIQAANTIKKVEGMNRLQSLTTLHLRDNQLEALDGFVEDLKMLQYINFRWLYMPLMMLQILKQAVLKWDVKYQVWSNNLPFAFRHYPALQIKLLLWRWIYHTLQKLWNGFFWNQLYGVCLFNKRHFKGTLFKTC